jgi:hypothetical protein
MSDFFHFEPSASDPYFQLATFSTVLQQKIAYMPAITDSYYCYDPLVFFDSTFHHFAVAAVIDSVRLRM